MLCIDNEGVMEKVMNDIYLKELVLTNDMAVLQSHYLGLDTEIKNDKLHTKRFDKRDAFNFKIVNFIDPRVESIPHKPK